MNEFSAFIRARRQQLCKTQADIAAECGISSPDFISLVEAGRRRVKLERVPRLAEVLGVDPTYLCRLALTSWAPQFAAALELPGEERHEAAA